MNNQKQKNFILTKRTHSLGSKIQRTQSRNSLTKQNEHPDASNLSKYFRQQQKEEFNPDQTDRFLTQTKNKLYCSSQKLQQFHKKKQQFRFINQTLNFKNVSKQLKETKQKILSKNFIKGSKTTYQINKSKHEGKSETFDEYDLNKKCMLIQKVLSFDEALNFRTQLAKKISQLKLEYSEDDMMRDKLIKYFINHQIISRFLEESAKDTTKLVMKKLNINLYHKMKDQMVALLSNQEHFQKHIQQINTQEQLRINSLLKRTPYNQQRLVKVHIKPKKSANYEKPILQKIEDLLEISKNNIKQAFINFGQVPKSYEIQLQFNQRLNNNFLVE